MNSYLTNTNLAHFVPTKITPKIILGILSLIILLVYLFKAINASEPQQVSYTNWLNTQTAEEDYAQLSQTVFTIQFAIDQAPEKHEHNSQNISSNDVQLKPVIWQVVGSKTDQEVNRKLARLMELAKASAVFSKPASESESGNILVTLTSPGSSFSSSLNRKQVERAPELRTFFKLFELYANP